jgi:hypothetical protein
MHHNYGAWSAVNQITARFSRVTDLRVSISGQTFEWHVSALAISEGTRPDDAGVERPCLVAEVSSPRRADGLRPAPAFLFRFEAASVDERREP